MSLINPVVETITEPAEAVVGKEFENLAPAVEVEFQEGQETEVVVESVEVVESVDVERVLEIDANTLARSIASDPQALSLLAEALAGVPGFAESLAAGVFLEAPAVPQRVTLKIVGSESPRTAPVTAPQTREVVQASAAPAVPVPNATAKKRSILNLVRS